ncbi:two-component system response regulator PilR (NtrC family) [Paucibacter oligotrophus]|uniref:Two-component system response regulator PilR (NtrC family) n=1 Tax=Roseateles oligotrophus TaxID=1769250 RepID=A0A840LF85_9BURK|nr:sigma-54 dependent transcriptional regulator [Roseateles oligotrophus]MBB4845303.1 two-component system response regulator PilR (NtrC family) [Roseateles oligotrophus]
MSTTSPFSLLVVDDEPDLRTLYELTLLREGYELETAGTVEEGLRQLKRRDFSAVITDMRLPDGSGLDILQWLEAQGRKEKTLVITAYGSAENAVEALKAGAYDYLTKPVDLRQFRLVVASALGRVPAVAATVVPANLPSESQAAQPRTPAATPLAGAPGKPAPAAAAPAAALKLPVTALSRLAGCSAAIQELRQLIEKVGRSMAPVLVQGESGTGKELVARAIHDSGSRLRQRFVAVNCGAIPEALLEAEFFGYRKGAFTGANEDREGFFQAADGGTLFLDEIGDLPLTMQSKLLRSIQERSVRPVGAVLEAQVNVRILSATHKDLSAEVAAGRFRQDLFYRLNVIQLRVPPLRERIEDVALISDKVLERIAADAGVSPVPRLTAAALALLQRYAFPGNVRELENLLHRALALAGGEWIDAGDLGLPEAMLGGLDEPLEPNLALPVGLLPIEPAQGREPLPSDLVVYLDEVERDILLRALALHRFNRTAAGASLGLSLRQIRYRMARLGITDAEDA